MSLSFQRDVYDPVGITVGHADNLSDDVDEGIHYSTYTLSTRYN